MPFGVWKFLVVDWLAVGVYEINAVILTDCCHTTTEYPSLVKLWLCNNLACMDIQIATFTAYPM